MIISKENPSTKSEMELFTTEFQLPSPFVNFPALEKQYNLLHSARCISCVSTPDQQEKAVAVAREVRTLVKSVEKTRSELTAPLLQAQRHLKALADDYVSPLQVEQWRVEELLTRFTDSERKRVEFEERQRQKQLEEAEKERLAALAAAEKAASKVNTEKQLEKAIAAEQVAVQAEQAVQQIISAPLPGVSRVAGASTGKVLRYEVTNIHELYKARPELCKIEIKKSAIQSTCVPEMPVPGLKLWWETQTNIRGY